MITVTFMISIFIFLVNRSTIYEHFPLCMTFYFQALSIVYDVLLFLSTTVPPIIKIKRQMMEVCSLSQLINVVYV